MESKNIGLTQALSELIEVNSSRMKGYNKALDNTKEGQVELRSFCNERIAEIREDIAALKAKAIHLASDFDNQGNSSVKVNSIVTDIRWAFTETNRDAILDFCLAFESESLKSYDDILGAHIEMGADTRQLIISQKTRMLQSLEQIQELRSAFVV